MVLIEKIDGTPMSGVPTPSALPLSVRQNILCQIVDIDTKIYEMGVALPDLAPRNVMLVGLPERPRVVFIDFADALLTGPGDDADPRGIDPFLGQYVSPLLRWTKKYGGPSDFSEWVDWNWDTWLYGQFRRTRETITPEMRARWS